MFLLSGLESLMTIFPVLFFFAGIVSLFVTFFPLYITFLVAVTLTTAFFTVLIVTVFLPLRAVTLRGSVFFAFRSAFLEVIILQYLFQSDLLQKHSESPLAV